MDPAALFARYQDLQRYVGWESVDEERVRQVAPALRPSFPAIIDDFYAEIERHPAVRRVITGGEEQVARLKGSLLNWIRELFEGQYDEDYVLRRWKVGLRHVQVGLDQVYVNAAVARLRMGLLTAHERLGIPPSEEVLLTRRSINKLLDLDLALIEDAYQAEFIDRQRRAERLATIGQVAGGIAHELRNPLNVIKTSIYFLQNAKNASPEKLAAHLERIDRQTTLADHVITALHDFARLPLPKLAEVSLAQWLPEVLREASLPTAIEVACEVPADLPPVLADPLQLRIVFANLVRNAQEAMTGGGKLVLRARQAGPLIEVDVADTGSGMSPDDLMRVMEPFHSTKARGLGLGLAIVKAIVEKHQGRITVASVPGAGTTFTLALPASLPSA